MKSLQSLVAITAAVFFSTSAIAEDAKPAEWLFVHTAQTAEMTSDTTLFIERINNKHENHTHISNSLSHGTIL